MLPTSSTLKTTEDTPHNVETHSCTPLASSSNVNRPPLIIRHSKYKWIRNTTPVGTGTLVRNRSKSSSISDKSSIKLINFEDSVASSETLCTTFSNSSETDYKMNLRRRSLSNHLDDQSSIGRNSLEMTNTRLGSETSQNQNLSNSIFSTSTNCLVFTNSRLQLKIDPDQTLSSIAFDDEIRVALPPNVSLQDFRECPPHHISHLLRITREKNILLKKKRKRNKKPKDEQIQEQHPVRPTNFYQLPVSGAITHEKTTLPPVELPTSTLRINSKKPSWKFLPSDLLKLRFANTVKKSDLTTRLKKLKLYVNETQLPLVMPTQLSTKTFDITSITPDIKIREYLSSSWHDLDDDIEETTSREIYESLRQFVDNFDEERSNDTVVENSKLKKKKNKNNEVNDSKKKSQNEAEENLSFEDFYTEAEVQKGLQEGILFKEAIRINPKNFKEAYISVDKNLDIFIDGVYDRNRALDGDVVIIALHPKEKWKVHPDESVQKCGKVVYIAKRNHPGTAVGYLKILFKRNKIDKFMLIPRDCRIPKIAIPVNLCPTNMKKDPKHYENCLYQARIIKWDTINFTEGILLRKLGQQNDIETETKCILLENHFHDEKIKEYKQYLPKIEESLAKNEFENRLDLRTLCIFSIDPIGAKDLDDALSCVELPNGHFEVGIHISDVSHYLTPDTPLDLSVQENATSVYLVQKVFHMLPNELCSLCSLTPGADKLAFSLLVEFNEDAQIVDHRFTKSVIRSCSQFVYQNAQEILDREFDHLEPHNFPIIENGFTLVDCAKTIINLQFLSKKLRKRRFDEGALKIDQPKIVFNFDDDHVPSSYSLFVPKESNWLIEEFMLVANILTANRIREKYPDLALLRLHSPPLEKSLSMVIESLEKIGIYIDISNAGSIHHSMMRYDGCDEIGIARMAVIINLLVKPMMKARYVCSSSESKNDAEYWHYALNVPFYTHFTSPIRRYADIVVHRLLASSLGYCELPKWSSEDVQSIADNCNKKKYDSKRASEASADLFLKLYLRKHGPVTVRAVVIDVKERFFEVVDLSARKLNRVYVDKIKPAHVKFESLEGMNSLLVTWKGDTDDDSVEQIIQMFTIIDVQMAYNPLLNKIIVILLKPSP